jgi:tripartite-type tricarboxylate transporter receptor subunit TctC
MKTRTGIKSCSRVCMFLLSIMGMGLLLGPATVESQEVKFPTKPVEILVPFQAGGSMDLVSRVLAEYLPQELKIPVVVKNQPGAGGMTGTTTFLRAKPDGYSIVVGNAASLISIVQLASNPPYDPRKDLLPLGYIADTPYALVVPKASPFNSFDEFAQYGRNNPGKLKGGFANVGSEGHFAVLSVLRDAKIDGKQVPFTGAADTTSAIVGGHVDWIVKTVPSAMPYIKSGDMKALLQTRKTSQLPNLPTGVEKGLPNFTITANLWVAFFAHPNTPKPTYDILVSAIANTVKKPEVSKKLDDLGLDVAYKNPRECSTLIEDQWRSYALIIKEMGLKVN